MYAECPHCHAIFRVTEEILTRAGGKVRCGECGVVFEVVDFRSVAENEPPTDEILVPGSDGKKPAAGDDSIEVVPQAPEQPVIEPADSGAPLPNGLPTSFDEAPVETAIEEPEADDFELIIEERSEAEESDDRDRRRRRLAGSLVAVLLLLLLTAQVLVARRNAVLAAMPAMRPVISGLCRVAGCVVDPRRDVERIELASHSVFSHPHSEGALMIRATIVNTADFPQPYPVIDLTLSDIQGRPVARRRFAPDEYLDTPASLPALMQPGEPVAVRIEVSDPGKNALSFQFDFL